jgi:hypothetical protein
MHTTLHRMRNVVSKSGSLEFESCEECWKWQTTQESWNLSTVSIWDRVLCGEILDFSQNLIVENLNPYSLLLIDENGSANPC